MPHSSTQLHLDDIHTLAFAGGGNRCWWQAGVVSQLLDMGWKLPPTLVGTSAGAAIATSLAPMVMAAKRKSTERIKREQKT